MGMAYVEGERDLLAHVEVVRGANSGNEGMGVASQVEIGLRSQGLEWAITTTRWPSVRVSAWLRVT